MKWDMSDAVRPEAPDTKHPGYEMIPAGSVWRGRRVPYDNVNYDETPNSYCHTFRGEWETNFNRYWLGSECYCNKGLCNSGHQVGLSFGTLALLTIFMSVLNNWYHALISQNSCWYKIFPQTTQDNNTGNKNKISKIKDLLFSCLEICYWIPNRSHQNIEWSDLSKQTDIWLQPDAFSWDLLI